MIRTLSLIAIVGFILSVGCLAGAFALTGGPFSIDDNFHFHRGSWPAELTDSANVPTREVARLPRPQAI